MFYLRRLKGNSMSPTLKSGQVVLLKKQTSYKVGQIVSVKTAGNLFLKRLKMELGQGVYLEGEHPESSHLLVDKNCLEAALVCRLPWF